MQTTQQNYRPSKRSTKPDDLLGKIPPNNQEAERAVLGAILLHDAGLAQISDFLEPSDFYLLAHQIIYKAMIEITKQTKRVDVVTLQDVLTSKNQLDAIGGLSYIVQLQEDIPDMGLIEQHAHIIKEKSILREVIKTAANTIAQCYAQDEKVVDDIIKNAEKSFSDIKEATHKDGIEIIPYTLANLEADVIKTKEGLLTGYYKLDEIVRIPNEAVTLVAGRPSHGKTTFMENIFLNMIWEYPELRFYFFSYEETRQQIAIKIINILSGYTLHQTQNINWIQGYIKNKKNNNDALEKGKQLYNDLAISGRLNIVGEQYHVKTLQDIITKIKSQGPIGAVFIDYIQKIKNDRFGTRQQEIQDTSSNILETAKTLSIPIVLGAQLSRDKDSKDKVRLENLRECGDLEQDAQVVLGLFNPAMEKAHETNSPVRETVVPITVTPLKNRNGIANVDIQLSFDRPILTITDSKEKESEK